MRVWFDNRRENLNFKIDRNKFKILFSCGLTTGGKNQISKFFRKDQILSRGIEMGERDGKEWGIRNESLVQR